MTTPETTSDNLYGLEVRKSTMTHFLDDIRWRFWKVINPSKKELRSSWFQENHGVSKSEKGGTLGITLAEIINIGTIPVFVDCDIQWEFFTTRKKPLLPQNKPIEHENIYGLDILKSGWKIEWVKYREIIKDSWEDAQAEVFVDFIYTSPKWEKTQITNMKSGHFKTLFSLITSTEPPIQVQ